MNVDRSVSKKREMRLKAEVMKQVQEMKRLRRGGRRNEVLTDDFQTDTSASATTTNNITTKCDQPSIVKSSSRSLLPSPAPTSIVSSTREDSPALPLQLRQSQPTPIETTVYNGTQVMQIRAPSGVLIMRRCTDGFVNFEQCLEASGLAPLKRDLLLRDDQIVKCYWEGEFSSIAGSDLFGKYWVSTQIVERLAKQAGFWEGYGIKELCKAPLPRQAILST
jgi:hypothetical protein